MVHLLALFIKGTKARGCFKVSAALAAVFALGLVSAAVAAENIYWKGEDGAYLNDATNWEGDAPFYGVSENNMKFWDVPSKAYTVRLSDDLVCAGTVDFTDAPHAATVTWDLGGHTLTFLTQYASHCHQNWTNIFENGTIAFTNSAGAIQRVNFWHAKSGYAMFLKGTATFIGNMEFSDGGTKTLDIRDGAQWHGGMQAKGYQCQVNITGNGTMVNLANKEFALGGDPNNSNQAGEVMGYITAGAVVTNAGSILVGGESNQSAGGKCQLLVDNATLAMAPSGASGMVTVGGGSQNDVWKDGVKVGTVEKISSENILKIVNGSVVDFANNRFSVGNSMWKMRSGGSGSHSNLVYVAGEGTVFTAMLANADWPGVIGHNGNWNQLHLTDGAYMNTGYLCAGGQGKQWGEGGTSLWNRVTVENGAFLDSNAKLHCATRHVDDFNNGRMVTALNASNVYEVVNGGKAKAQGVVVGTLACARDNRFIVDGEGSSFELYGLGDVSIGHSGAFGNGFEVTGGATLTGDVNEFRIGSEIYHQGDIEKVGVTASNNYIRIEKTDVSVKNTIQIGHYYNGGNTLWVGDGAVVKAGGVIFRGFGQRLIVSNGTLRVSCDDGQGTRHGLRPAWSDNVYTMDYSGKHQFDFYEQGRIYNGRDMGCDFTNACKFVFHIPAEGYKEAAFESTSSSIRFSDDSEFVFDFDAVSKDGLKSVPLLKYSGNNATRLIFSDELLAKINTAAEKTRQGSRVKLSSDCRELTLRVGSQGLLISVR